ncbi:MAG: ComF family protein [Pseudomonadota bacterium]
MQSLLKLIYPSQCLSCGTQVDSDAALCGVCWRDSPFICGSTCAKCGVALPGSAPGDSDALCDDCLTTARPWARGVSVMHYGATARRLILSLKHGDRQDLVEPLASWMLERARSLITPATVIVPVPIPRRRLASRRYNQAALLSQRIARMAGARGVPDALYRLRHTPPQEGLSRDARFALQRGAIAPQPGRRGAIHGRPVLLVDDVMTSGATLAAATEALRAGGASAVNVLTLARVAKDF